VARLLLTSGARVNVKDNQLLTPLHVACSRDYHVRTSICAVFFHISQSTPNGIYVVYTADVDSERCFTHFTISNMADDIMVPLTDSWSGGAAGRHTTTRTALSARHTISQDFVHEMTVG